MKYLILTVISVLISTSVFGDVVSKQGKLEELMKLQGLYETIEMQLKYCEEQAKTIGPKMMEQLSNEFPNMDELLIENMNVAYDRYLESVKPTWTIEEAVNSWAGFYGSYVSEDELDQILQFYKSPIGQKDINANQSAMPSWIVFFSEKNNDVLEKATQVYIAELKEIVSKARAEKKG